MTPLAVEEVQAILHLLHGNRVFLSSMFKDKLFEEQEGAFMLNLLPDLYESFPGVFSSKSCTVRTLCILNKELDLEDLFEDRGGQHLQTPDEPTNGNDTHGSVPPSG